MREKLNSAVILVWLVTVSVLFPFTSHLAAAEDPGPCLSCHGTDGQFMQFKNQERLSVFVRANEIDKSVHRSQPCTGCHSDISMQDHPGRKFGSRNEFIQKTARACRTCHADDQLAAKPNHAFTVKSADAPPARHAMARIRCERSLP